MFVPVLNIIKEVIRKEEYSVPSEDVLIRKKGLEAKKKKSYFYKFWGADRKFHIM